MNVEFINPWLTNFRCNGEDPIPIHRNGQVHSNTEARIPIIVVINKKIYMYYLFVHNNPK